MGIFKHSPFHGADSQDHGRLSVGQISKALVRKKLVHTCWAPWSVLQKTSGDLWARPPVLTPVPSQANHNSSRRHRFQTGQTPEKCARMFQAVSRNNNDVKTPKHVFVCHCLGASDLWSRHGTASNYFCFALARGFRHTCAASGEERTASDTHVPASSNAINDGYKRQDDVPTAVDGAWHIVLLSQILVCGVHVLGETLHDVFTEQIQRHATLVVHTCTEPCTQASPNSKELSV